MSEAMKTSVRGEAEEDATSIWFHEENTPNFTTSLRLRSMGCDVKSDYQRIQVIDTFQFGKTLVLDGYTQSAAADEAIYHESLVHPSLLRHPNPKRIFIGGGGELATARECLRHTSVESVTMVDLDKLVVDTCRERLPEWNAGSTEDPRLNLVYGDAKVYLEDYPDSEPRFDVIILDICDPIEGGPAVHLYMLEFYKIVKSRLSPDGLCVTQSGPGGVFNFAECFTAIHKTMTRAFDTVVPYTVTVPTFGSEWSYCMAYSATKRPHPLKEDIAEIDDMVSKRIKGEMKHYDGVTHVHMFHLLKAVRQGLLKEERIITKETPVFML